tara:strand:+ start:51 stop:203 length:153 start_codon:yes stop_codon:yes gene_type:complete
MRVYVFFDEFVPQVNARVVVAEVYADEVAILSNGAMVIRNIVTFDFGVTT